MRNHSYRNINPIDLENTILQYSLSNKIIGEMKSYCKDLNCEPEQPEFTTDLERGLIDEVDTSEYIK